MRLFFDQNLSPRLKGRLADLYPDSVHISDVGLATADDLAVWAYARDHGLTNSLSHHRPTGNRDREPGEKIGLIRGQKRDGAGYVLGAGKTPNRRARQRPGE